MYKQKVTCLVSKQAFKGIPMQDLLGYIPLAKVTQLLSVITNERDLLLFTLLFQTGCRVSELVGGISWKDKTKVFTGLTVKNINVDECALILETLKRRQYPPPQRMVNIPKKTMRMLLSYVKKTGCRDRVFTISRVQVFRLFRKYGRLSGVEKIGKKGIHPHHARHSSAIAEIKKHNDLEQLRKLQKKLGHANIETTAEYLQFSPDRQKEVEETFADM